MKAFRRLIRSVFLMLMPVTAYVLITTLFKFTYDLTNIHVLQTRVFQPNRHFSNHVIVQEETGKSKNPPYLKLTNGNAILYSAIFVSRKDSVNNNNTFPLKPKTEIVVNGWERKQKNATKFFCCVLLRNEKTIYLVQKTQKFHWVMQSKLHATQFRCTTEVLKSNVIGISITYNRMCPKNSSEYITISDDGLYLASNTIVNQSEIYTDGTVQKTDRNVKIGVCAKLAFGELDARRLVEWFEVHRTFGVDTVIAYSYKLNAYARRVFDYYEKLGMSKLFEFDIPEKATIRRDVGTKNVQSWNDEQVALYDCQERLRNHDFVAVVDTDEFIVPRTKSFVNAWKKFFKEQFRKERMSTIIFKVKVHVTTWKKKTHPLFIGQYTSCTHPMMDRVKEVYMPSRVKPGSVSTHFLKPLQGFKRSLVNPNVASIHHFRSCRKEWLTNDLDKKAGNGQKNSTVTQVKKKHSVMCGSLQQHHSVEIEDLSNAVINQVLQANKNIGL